MAAGERVAVINKLILKCGFISIGRMAILVKNVKSILSKSLKTAWVPSDVLRNGIRHSHGVSIRLSYGNCFPLETKSLHIPNTQNNYTEGVYE